MACGGCREAGHVISRGPRQRVSPSGRLSHGRVKRRAQGLLTGAAMPETEQHYVNRTGWLRAAVLGANDGIISTASLIMGVVAATDSRAQILTAAVAGWAAGA